MSSEATMDTPPGTKAGIATTPIFLTDNDKEKPQDISWEVSDGTEYEDNLEPESEKEDIKTAEEEKEEPTSEQEESESEEDEDEEEKQPLKKKPNKIPRDRRIAELTRRAKEAESFAHNILNEKKHLEKVIAQKELEAIKSHENLLTAHRDTLENALADAHEEGDPKAIAKITNQLSAYNAELRIINQQKERQTLENNAFKEESTQNSFQINNDVSYQDAGQEWMKKNVWANPNSKHFDRELYEEADKYSIELARQYKFDNREDEVGSPEFFDEITDYIKESYNISPRVSQVKSPLKERIQMKTPTSPPVSSVNRPSSTSGNTTPKKEIILTPQQREIAHSLAGTVKDKNGNRITDRKQLEEVYKRYLKG